jgi:hypothetical protein
MVAREEDISLDEHYRSNDMAMVTYLKICGHSVQRVVWESGTCYWVFWVSDTLLDQVEVFIGGNALIEPREYNKVFNQTKREFYDSKPPGIRVAGTPSVS